MTTHRPHPCCQVRGELSLRTVAAHLLTPLHPSMHSPTTTPGRRQACPEEPTPQNTLQHQASHTAAMTATAAAPSPELTQAQVHKVQLLLAWGPSLAQQEVLRLDVTMHVPAADTHTHSSSSSRGWAPHSHTAASCKKCLHDWASRPAMFSLSAGAAAAPFDANHCSHTPAAIPLPHCLASSACNRPLAPACPGQCRCCSCCVHRTAAAPRCCSPLAVQVLED